MTGPSASARVDVLYVEDDEAWAGLVQLWLKARGMNVRCMRSGAEMLRYLDGCAVLPRCLLLDLSLGDTHGLTLCDHVKRSPRLQSLPVIVLTARDIKATEVLAHYALYRVQKDAKTEAELISVIKSVLNQQGRAQGVIDAGDLHLEPVERIVFRAGKRIARLSPGHYSALSLLMRSSPIPVPDDALYASFLSRHSYDIEDHENAARQVLRNYVSALRKNLGRAIGDRIVRAEAGYFYILYG
ncbi:MAG: response regulator transcription factor [Elusimicrobia bacterium]|nr:response regulator transcription factor [Elusimicrobiota bacterium]